MEHVKREPMKSPTGREPTAFTVQAVKDLVSKDTTAPDNVVTLRTPLPKSYLQQPPHMRGPVPVTPTSATPARAPGTTPPAKDHAQPAKKTFFLGRLIGG